MSDEMRRDHDSGHSPLRTEISQVRSEVTRLQTLVLDTVERLAVLETSARFADQQRQLLIETTGRVSERLGEIITTIKGYEPLARDIGELKQRVSKHDEVIIDAGGQIKGAARIWNLVWAGLGFLVATAMAWLKVRVG